MERLCIGKGLWWLSSLGLTFRWGDVGRGEVDYGVLGDRVVRGEVQWGGMRPGDGVGEGWGVARCGVGLVGWRTEDEDGGWDVDGDGDGLG